MIENRSYVVKSGTNLDSVISKLNELGQEGWETASVLKNNQNEIIFFLKRKVEIKKKKKG